MTRYAVGDLQGCLKPLQCLLERVAFNPEQDQLWLVGDLVNRGPDSLDTLTYLYPLRESLRVTLGNHDLHALALARGATENGRHRTLGALLDSPALEAYMDWFRRMPLCLRAEAGDYVMSHAGIPPVWSTAEALARSEEVERVLRDDERIDDFLRDMYGNEPSRWSDELQGMERLRVIINYFTRMRCLRADASLELSYKGPVNGIPEGSFPWFTLPEREPRTEVQLFGHWAALEGHTERADCIGLDTGCVWGRQLTLYDMDQRVFHRCDCG